MSDVPIIEPKKMSAVKVLHRILRQSIWFVFPLLWIALLFICAGRVDWLRGWVCVGIYFATMAATGIIVRRANRDLLGRRAKVQHKDTKRFDKVILSLFFPLTLIQPAVAGLDAVRFGWSSILFWTIYPAAGLFLLGMALVTWSLAANPYAESSVRIQSERGHSVIRSGPYAFVRHPMYVGSILMYPATGWMFGSIAAVAVGLLLAALLIVRTALEDRTLRRELPGYAEYSLATRYRLLPGIW